MSELIELLNAEDGCIVEVRNGEIYIEALCK